MHSLTHSHHKRNNLPSRSAIKKAIERELDSIKSSLGDNEEQINLEKLISMYSDLLVVEKRGEEVPLMRSEEYRAIVDSTTIVSKTDATGAIVYVNDKFCGVSGYEAPELLGKSHSIIRHPDESKKTYLELWQTISKKRIWRGRIRNKAKCGKTYWQDAVIIPQIDEETGDIISYVGFGHEVSEIVEQNLSLEQLYTIIKESKNKDQEKIKEVETLNQIILDKQDEAVAVLTDKAELVKANKAFLKTFDISSITDKRINEIINELNEKSGEKLLTTKDEDQHKIKLNDKIFLMNIKSINEYKILYLNDITKTQEEIDNAKMESFAKSSFLATMSHEIRTPLNGIMPYVDILLHTNLSKEQRDYLETIHKSSSSLLRIINDILDFSKIESGKLEIENISFNPIKEFEALVELYVAKANEKNIDFCVFIDPLIPEFLIGDSTRIKQILSNLLSNAIKFTNENGEIQFNIELQWVTDDSAILDIYVIDNGKGIPEEKQAQIFTPFSQEDESISRRYGGTGLGLSISQNIAHMMNSEIKLDSTYGKGSMFYFTLELPIVQTCRLESQINNNNETKIGIYITAEGVKKCAMILNRYFEAFGFSYKYIQEPTQVEDCNLVFIISTGKDRISWINDEFLAKKKVITIIPSKAENANKFKSHATIQMPVNGSKIYDAIIESDKAKEALDYIHKQPIADKKYNATILLAEDNTTNQKVALALFKKLGIDVILANNGLEAFELYKQNLKTIVLIFMDIHMPVMDGLESVALIREHEQKLNIEKKTIIALTADAIKTHIQNYLEAGMDDYLLKPIELDKFNATVDRYLSHKATNIKPESYDLELEEEVIDLNDIDLEDGEQELVNMINEYNIKYISNALDLDIQTSKLIYDDFLQNWAALKEKMQTAVDELDYETIRSVSHQLKSACGSIGFNEAGKIAKELEEMARDSREKTDKDAYEKAFKNLVFSMEFMIE